MSQLTIYADDAPGSGRVLNDVGAIQQALGEIGVRFERWSAQAPVAAGASQEQVLAAYRVEIDRLVAERGYQSVDVVSLDATHPDRVALRRKFLAEHTHADDEVRFFVAGSGLFVLHAAGQVYAALCEKDDLISVPAGIAHWFDMGSAPAFTCIRLFNDPAGWVADFTGDDIATRFPVLA
ncbi:cupin [Achromobacter seleniivolatilans]|uniref:Acireductone dioxygenase n=1 Tax=Achromobacter seleniivolatilans TaxID=3047478 RepID=A0ABY9LYH3_9BURK|nr:cupin [Achromobacter sp. R39]WMD19821.1 cupin [Achromobacter sp. R39]